LDQRITHQGLARFEITATEFGTLVPIVVLLYGRAVQNLGDQEVIQFYAAAGDTLSENLRALCLEELQKRQLIN
jgi:hypothetical protein